MRFRVGHPPIAGVVAGGPDHEFPSSGTSIIMRRTMRMSSSVRLSETPRVRAVSRTVAGRTLSSLIGCAMTSIIATGQNRKKLRQGSAA
jgi:hypothetical protein